MSYIRFMTPAPPNLEYFLEGTCSPVIGLAIVENEGLQDSVEPVYLHHGVARVGHTARGIGQLLTAREAAKCAEEYLARRLAERCSASG